MSGLAIPLAAVVVVTVDGQGGQEQLQGGQEVEDPPDPLDPPEEDPEDPPEEDPVEPEDPLEEDPAP